MHIGRSKEAHSQKVQPRRNFPRQLPFLHCKQGHPPHARKVLPCTNNQLSRAQDLYQFKLCNNKVHEEGWARMKGEKEVKGMMYYSRTSQDH